MVRLVAIAAVLALAGYVTGCDYNLTSQPGSQGGPQGLKVSIAAAGQNVSRWTMETSSSLELAATVRNFTTDSTVTWSFAGKQLGDLAVDGASAIFTSPDSIVGTSDTVILQVTSNEDASKYARITIVIVPFNAPAQATIMIDPVSASIEPGATQQFTATVQNATDATVLWSVIDGPGTVSTTGLYTAPSSITGSFVKSTVRAALAADTTIWTAAEVTIAPAIAPCYWGMTRQIIEGNCMASGCHGTINRDREAPSLVTARDILTVARQREHGYSKLTYYLQFASGEDRMPRNQPPLSSEQIATIQKWIDGGMDTSACPDVPPSACDTTSVKYSTFVRATLQNACLGCHSGANPTGKYDLSTYGGVAVVAHSGQLIGSISHTSPYRAMPDGGQMLDDCTIAKIRAWVNAGALDN
jgi:hypothetical protein